MESRFTRTAPQLRLRRAAGAVLAAVVCALLAAARPALADDDAQSAAAYEPTGIGQIFQRPDSADGQDPTLYEKYPDSAYSFDVEDAGWLHPIQGALDGVFNGLANFFFMGTRGITQASITMTWQATDMEVFTSIDDNVAKGVGGVADHFAGWLLPSALVIGGAGALAKTRGRVGEAIREFGVIILAGMGVFLLSTNSATIVDAVTGVHTLGSQSASAIAGATTTDMATPFQGPTPTYGDDETTNSMRRMSDSIWRTYVVTPWCYAEFGTLAACQRWGEELLARPSGKDEGQRVGYIQSEIKTAVGGDSTNAYRTIAGHEGTYRLAIAALSLISALVFAGVTLIVALTSLVNMLLVYLMLLTAGFFIPFAVIPGTPRRWAANWAAATVGFFLVSIGALIALVAALALVSATITATASIGWGSMMIFTLGAIYAGYKAVKALVHIFSASGEHPTIGGMLAAAANIKRLMPRRKHAPKPPKDAAADGPPRIPPPPREDEHEHRALPSYAQYTRPRPEPMGKDLTRHREQWRPHQGQAPSPHGPAPRPRPHGPFPMPERLAGHLPPGRPGSGHGRQPADAGPKVFTPEIVTPGRAHAPEPYTPELRPNPPRIIDVTPRASRAAARKHNARAAERVRAEAARRKRAQRAAEAARRDYARAQQEQGAPRATWTPAKE